MMLECRTCHGRYTPVLPDGTVYFHHCPPLSAAELKAGVQAGTVQLSKADADRLHAAQDADAKTPPKAGESTQADLVLASLSIDRPNFRDENLVGGRDEKTAKQLKAPGTGVQAVP